MLLLLSSNPIRSSHGWTPGSPQSHALGRIPSQPTTAALSKAQANLEWTPHFGFPLARHWAGRGWDRISFTPLSLPISRLRLLPRTHPTLEHTTCTTEVNLSSNSKQAYDALITTRTLLRCFGFGAKLEGHQARARLSRLSFALQQQQQNNDDETHPGPETRREKQNREREREEKVWLASACPPTVSRLLARLVLTGSLFPVECFWFTSGQTSVGNNTRRGDQAMSPRILLIH
jgi:hypothetical protein